MKPSRDHFIMVLGRRFSSAAIWDAVSRFGIVVVSVLAGHDAALGERGGRETARRASAGIQNRISLVFRAAISQTLYTVTRLPIGYDSAHRPEA